MKLSDLLESYVMPQGKRSDDTSCALDQDYRKLGFTNAGRMRTNGSVTGMSYYSGDYYWRYASYGGDISIESLSDVLRSHGYERVDYKKNEFKNNQYVFMNGYESAVIKAYPPKNINGRHIPERPFEISHFYKKGYTSKLTANDFKW